MDNVTSRSTTFEKTNVTAKQIHLLVSNFPNFKQATASANIRFLDFVSTIYNGRSRRSSNTIIIRLPQAAESGDIRLEKVVLCEVGHTLFSDDNVRLKCYDLNKIIRE